jgi:hypothetical protein
MLKKILIYIGCVFCLEGYAQRHFTDASSFAEVSAEQKRLDSLGFGNAYEYELADSTLPNGKRYLMGRYEYGVDGVVALKISYGFDTDSTAWYYAYNTKGRVTQESMISRRAIIQSSYHYNRKTGRLDSVIVNKGALYKHVAKYNKDGTIGGFDVLKIDFQPDTTKKKIKLKRVLTPHERIVVSYDTTKHPIADTLYSLEGQVKSASAYTYDEAGRMTSHAYHEPGMAIWTNYYFYDEKGSLAKRIHSDITTGKRVHFVMFYK